MMEIMERLQIMDKLFDTLLGAVFLSRDRVSGQFYAVKISSISPKKIQAARNLGICEDAIKEANFCVKIKPHRNLIKVYATFKTDHFLFFERSKSSCQVLVLEYLSEGDLFEYLRKHGRLSERTTKIIILQMIEALEHLHAQGVCHMDVSLENILLDQKATIAKLCDYGQTHKMCIQNKYIAIEKHHRPGKARYMAPEIVFGEKIVNGEAVDLYSLGIVAFCLLLGFHPYDNPDDPLSPFNFILLNDFDGLMRYHNVKKYSSVQKAIRDDCKEDLINDDTIWISDAGYNFLGKLICMKEQRITLHGAKAHSWMAN